MQEVSSRGLFLPQPASHRGRHSFRTPHNPLSFGHKIMTTLHLICDRSGEHVCDIAGHGSAYLLGQSLDGERSYTITPDTGHIWLDAGGDRCSDMGAIEPPYMPDDSAPAEEWERWASQCVVAAHAAGVRIDG